MSTAILEKAGTTAEFLYGGPAFLSEQAADPATILDVGSVYTKDASARSELFYKDDAGVVIQLTRVGTVMGFTSTATDTTATLPILTTTSATRAAIRIGSLAGDPSTPANGDVWYNSSTGKFRARENSVSVDLISTAVASGWTDDGAVVRLDTSGDVVSIGSASNLGKLFVNSTDAAAVVILGRGTTSQVGNLLTLQNVTPTNVFTVSANGTMVSASSLSSNNGAVTIGVTTTSDIAGTGNIQLVPASGSGAKMLLLGTGTEAFNIRTVAAGNYMNLNLSGTPAWTFGNAASNPSFTFLGTGTVQATGAIWTSGGSFLLGASFDVIIARDAANICAHKNGSAANTVRIYGTAAKYLSLSHNATDAIIDTESTTGGVKICAATTQKVAFYGVAPIVQGASVADATDAASAISQLNLLISRIEATGLIATV